MASVLSTERSFTYLKRETRSHLGARKAIGNGGKDGRSQSEIRELHRTKATCETTIHRDMKGSEQHIPLVWSQENRTSIFISALTYVFWTSDVRPNLRSIKYTLYRWSHAWCTIQSRHTETESIMSKNEETYTSKVERCQG
jgi:hypothetical protein